MGALLACALAVRLGLAWGVQQRVERTPGRLCLVAGDAEGYWELARNIVQRGEFTLYTPPRRVLRMPGFPLWLAAGMRLFGEPDSMPAESSLIVNNTPSRPRSTW